MFNQMKNGFFATAAVGALVLGLSGPAAADTIAFDVDGPGSTSGAPVGSIVGFDKVLVDNFKGQAAQAYTITTHLGADNLLTVGDTFNETFRIRIDAAQQPLGTNTQVYDLGLKSFLYVDVVLSGHISAFSGGPVTSAAGATDVSNLGNAILGIAFDSGSAKWFYDPAADFNNDIAVAGVGDTNIGTMSLLSGGADSFSFQNATATSKLGATFAFTTDPLANRWFSCPPAPANAAACTTDFQSLVPLNLVFALADSSVNLFGANPITGTNGAGGVNDLFLKVFDNGTTVQIQTVGVPEPSTLLMFGLGLLGLGFMARRRRAA